MSMIFYSFYQMLTFTLHNVPFQLLSTNIPPKKGTVSGPQNTLYEKIGGFSAPIS